METFEWVAPTSPLPQFEFSVDVTGDGIDALYRALGLPESESTSFTVALGDTAFVKRLGILVPVPRHTHMPKARYTDVQVDGENITLSWVAEPDSNGDAIIETLDKITVGMWLGALWQALVGLFKR